MEKMNSFGTITDTILVVDKKNKYAINKRALHLVYAFSMLSFTIFSLLLVGNFFTNLNSYTHINTSETSAASLLEKQNANNNNANNNRRSQGGAKKTRRRK